MNRRDMFKVLTAPIVLIPVLGSIKDPDYFRWRWLQQEECPPGSLVDLWAKAKDWEGHYLGKRTTDHPAVTGGLCWADGEKGILLLDPKITRWRYAA